MSEPQDDLHRVVLPIPDRPYAGLISYDAKEPDAYFAPIRSLRPPAGAPNVLVPLIDDVGFGASSAGEVTLYVDGDSVGTGRLGATEPIAFGYEFTDVGRDGQSPVTDEYPPGDANAFTGEIRWVELEAGGDSHDHLIDPDDILRVAMARQ